MTDLFRTTPRERLGLNPSRSTGIQKKEEEPTNVVMTIVTKGELWRESLWVMTVSVAAVRFGDHLTATKE